MASLTLGTVFKFDDRDGVEPELILGADGAPKEGSVNFKKLVRSIAPVASAASTEGCSLLRGRLTIEYASVLQAASRFLYLDMYHIQRTAFARWLRPSTSSPATSSRASLVQRACPRRTHPSHGRGPDPFTIERTRVRSWIASSDSGAASASGAG